MISEESARSAIDKALDVGLYGAEFIDALGIGVVMETCNGCGPEWMSATTRGMLTRWLDIFDPAFCIHDCRFGKDNDGSRVRFDHANDELRKNCKILARAAYAWWRPARYIWLHRANLVADACEDFGWSAWRDAFSETKKGKE